jgi:beta-lactamase superfamily II metal-dependent hydrolase
MTTRRGNGATTVARRKPRAKTGRRAPVDRITMRPAARHNGGERGAATRDVTVRMYNVGFGDCFLLRIPTSDGERKVLIDCGTHPGGAGPRKMKDVVQDIIAGVTDADGVARIDLVIGTHRHRDHVSGFDDEAWADVEVTEVWMPWTENPKDKEARDIRNRQSKLAMQLHSAFANPEVMAALPPEVDEPQRVQLRAMVMNALTNAPAMRTLHEGFAGRPKRRFLPAKNGRRSIETPTLPGVIIHLMGPSRNPGIIRDMDPPAGAGYLRRLDAASATDNGAPQPFHSDWAMSRGEFESLFGISPTEPAPQPLDLSERDMEEIRKTSAGEELAIAVALEKAVNGTSLMLMFQIGRAHLLFPGDAQWGTWQAAMADPEWREMLGKTVFYKIGHHGSHNATPKDFVEQIIGDDFWAMASTHLVKQWPQIPKKPLMKALAARKHARVVRSDEDKRLPKGFSGVQDRYIDAKVPI